MSPGTQLHKTEQCSRTVEKIQRILNLMFDIFPNFGHICAFVLVGRAKIHSAKESGIRGLNNLFFEE